MTITNGYATLDQVRRRLVDTSLPVKDGDLETVIEGVSRFVDKNRGRRFYAAAETRYYVPVSNDLVVIDDLLSLTTLKTDLDADGTFEQTWTSSDYLLAPYNASTDGEPYTSIERVFQGSLLFPMGSRGSRSGVRSRVAFRSVEVGGSFGYIASTPAAVHEFCVLLSMRVWMRREALFGSVVDVNKVTQIVGLNMDTELQLLLNTIPRRWTK